MTTRLMSGISGMPGLCIFIPEYLQKDVKILSQRSSGSHARGKNRIKKTGSNSANVWAVRRFPAPCYSPIVKFTVPSPLEPLTTVFGKGTCVSAPLWTPENKITIKKMSEWRVKKKSLNEDLESWRNFLFFSGVKHWEKRWLSLTAD